MTQTLEAKIGWTSDDYGVVRPGRAQGNVVLHIGEWTCRVDGPAFSPEQIQAITTCLRRAISDRILAAIEEEMKRGRELAHRRAFDAGREAAIANFRAASAPPDTVTLPKEPTEAMKGAAYEMARKTHSEQRAKAVAWDIVQGYRAMIEAWERE